MPLILRPGVRESRRLRDESTPITDDRVQMLELVCHTPAGLNVGARSVPFSRFRNVHNVAGAAVHRMGRRIGGGLRTVLSRFARSSRIIGWRHLDAYP